MGASLSDKRHEATRSDMIEDISHRRVSCDWLTNGN